MEEFQTLVSTQLPNLVKVWIWYQEDLNNTLPFWLVACTLFAYGYSIFSDQFNVYV